MALRRAAAVGVGLAAATLLAGGWAWACTPQPRVVSTSAESGPARSEVLVTGEGARPGAPIELRWNGVRGPVIGSGTADDAGAFASAVRLPDAGPGVHTIVAVVQDAGIGRTAFEITPARASTTRTRSPVWTTSFPSQSSGARGFDGGGVLLAVGTVGLAGGTAAAVLVRRRAVAGQSRS